MPRRIERGVDVLMSTAEVTSVPITLRRDEQTLRVSFERSTIEAHQKDDDVFRVRGFIGRQKKGGVTIAGGIADFGDVRPGRELIWSTYTMRNIPPGTTEVQIELTARKPFRIIGHIDIYRNSERLP